MKLQAKELKERLLLFLLLLPFGCLSAFDVSVRPLLDAVLHVAEAHPDGGLVDEVGELQLREDISEGVAIL